MDELLRHHDMPFGGDDDGSHSPAAKILKDLKEKCLAGAGRVRACVTTAKTKLGEVQVPARVSSAASKVKAAVAKHPVSPMLYVTVAALIAGVVIFQSTYIQAYAVQVDGVDVGLVADTAQVDAAVSHVESRVADVLGTSYDYDAEVTYTPVYSTQDELTDTQDIEEYMFETAGALMDGYVLTVGGQELGVAASEEDLQELLDRVAAAYITEDTVDYGFVEEVEITSRQISSDTQFDLDAIYDLLTSNSVEEAVYVVEKGDAFSRIAKAYDMTVSELSELNPDVVIDKIWVGQELIVQRSVPLLSVYTVNSETYEKTIESPVEYTDTDSMYVGDTKVTEQGEDGVALVTADVTYVNGYETERTVTSSTTLQEATTTRILRGTKEKPRTASTGSYAWPCSGTITSRYGYRSSGFHTGLDIAVPYGTAIKAADGGTVTFAGRQGGYGNLVIITHDNGAQTYYAHNSSLVVSVGDKVYQGQTIARAGSTGNSTGNHCHFEIRIGGSTVNPLNYLS